MSRSLYEERAVKTRDCHLTQKMGYDILTKEMRIIVYYRASTHGSKGDELWQFTLSIMKTSEVQE